MSGSRFEIEREQPKAPDGTVLEIRAAVGQIRQLTAAVNGIAPAEVDTASIVAGLQSLAVSLSGIAKSLQAVVDKEPKARKRTFTAKNNQSDRVWTIKEVVE